MEPSGDSIFDRYFSRILGNSSDWPEDIVDSGCDTDNYEDATGLHTDEVTAPSEADDGATAADAPEDWESKLGDVIQFESSGSIFAGFFCKVFENTIVSATSDNMDDKMSHTGDMPEIREAVEHEDTEKTTPTNTTETTEFDAPTNDVIPPPVGVPERENDNRFGMTEHSVMVMRRHSETWDSEMDDVGVKQGLPSSVTDMSVEIENETAIEHVKVSRDSSAEDVRYSSDESGRVIISKTVTETVTHYDYEVTASSGVSVESVGGVLKSSSGVGEDHHTSYQETDQWVTSRHINKLSSHMTTGESNDRNTLSMNKEVEGETPVSDSQSYNSGSYYDTNPADNHTEAVDTATSDNRCSNDHVTSSYGDTIAVDNTVSVDNITKALHHDVNAYDGDVDVALDGPNSSSSSDDDDRKNYDALQGMDATDDNVNTQDDNNIQPDDDNVSAFDDHINTPIAGDGTAPTANDMNTSDEGDADDGHIDEGEADDGHINTPIADTETTEFDAPTNDVIPPPEIKIVGVPERENDNRFGMTEHRVLVMRRHSETWDSEMDDVGVKQTLPSSVTDLSVEIENETAIEHVKVSHDSSTEDVRYSSDESGRVIISKTVTETPTTNDMNTSDEGDADDGHINTPIAGDSIAPTANDMNTSYEGDDGHGSMQACVDGGKASDDFVLETVDDPRVCDNDRRNRNYGDGGETKLHDQIATSGDFIKPVVNTSDDGIMLSDHDEMKASGDDRKAYGDEVKATNDEAKAIHEEEKASDDYVKESEDEVIASEDEVIASEDEVIASEDEVIASNDELRAFDDDKKPSDDDMKPFDEVKPYDDEVKPSDDEVKPSNDDMKTSDEVKPSDDEDMRPSGDEVKPSDDDMKPSDDEVKPSDDELNTSIDGEKASNDDMKPSGAEVKPSDDDMKPYDDEVKPSDDEEKPSDDEVKVPNDNEISASDDDTSDVISSIDYVSADHNVIKIDCNVTHALGNDITGGEANTINDDDVIACDGDKEETIITNADNDDKKITDVDLQTPVVEQGSVSIILQENDYARYDDTMSKDEHVSLPIDGHTKVSASVAEGGQLPSVEFVDDKENQGDADTGWSTDISKVDTGMMIMYDNDHMESSFTESSRQTRTRVTRVITQQEHITVSSHENQEKSSTAYTHHECTTSSIVETTPHLTIMRNRSPFSEIRTSEIVIDASIVEGAVGGIHVDHVGLEDVHGSMQVGDGYTYKFDKTAYEVMTTSDESGDSEEHQSGITGMAKTKDIHDDEQEEVISKIMSRTNTDDTTNPDKTDGYMEDTVMHIGDINIHSLPLETPDSVETDMTVLESTDGSINLCSDNEIDLIEKSHPAIDKDILTSEVDSDNETYEDSSGHSRDQVHHRLNTGTERIEKEDLLSIVSGMFQGGHLDLLEDTMVSQDTQDSSDNERTRIIQEEDSNIPISHMDTYVHTEEEHNEELFKNGNDEESTECHIGEHHESMNEEGEGDTGWTASQTVTNIHRVVDTRSTETIINETLLDTIHSEDIKDRSSSTSQDHDKIDDDNVLEDKEIVETTLHKTDDALGLEDLHGSMQVGDGYTYKFDKTAYEVMTISDEGGDSEEHQSGITGMAKTKDIHDDEQEEVISKIMSRTNTGDTTNPDKTDGYMEDTGIHIGDINIHSLPLETPDSVETDMTVLESTDGSINLCSDNEINLIEKSHPAIDKDILTSEVGSDNETYEDSSEHSRDQVHHRLNTGTERIEKEDLLSIVSGMIQGGHLDLLEDTMVSQDTQDSSDNERTRIIQEEDSNIPISHMDTHVHTEEEHNEELFRNGNDEESTECHIGEYHESMNKEGEGDTGWTGSQTVTNIHRVVDTRSTETIINETLLQTIHSEDIEDRSSSTSQDHDKIDDDNVLEDKEIVETTLHKTDDALCPDTDKSNAMIEGHMGSIMMEHTIHECISSTDADGTNISVKAIISDSNEPETSAKYSAEHLDNSGIHEVAVIDEDHSLAELDTGCNYRDVSIHHDTTLIGTSSDSMVHSNSYKEDNMWSRNVTSFTSSRRSEMVSTDVSMSQPSQQRDDEETSMYTNELSMENAAGEIVETTLYKMDDALCPDPDKSNAMIEGHMGSIMMEHTIHEYISSTDADGTNISVKAIIRNSDEPETSAEYSTERLDNSGIHEGAIIDEDHSLAELDTGCNYRDVSIHHDTTITGRSSDSMVNSYSYKEDNMWSRNVTSFTSSRRSEMVSTEVNMSQPSQQRDDEETSMHTTELSMENAAGGTTNWSTASATIGGEHKSTMIHIATEEIIGDSSDRRAFSTTDVSGHQYDKGKYDEVKNVCQELPTDITDPVSSHSLLTRNDFDQLSRTTDSAGSMFSHSTTAAIGEDFEGVQSDKMEQWQLDIQEGLRLYEVEQNAMAFKDIVSLVNSEDTSSRNYTYEDQVITYDSGASTRNQFESADQTNQRALHYTNHKMSTRTCTDATDLSTEHVIFRSGIHSGDIIPKYDSALGSSKHTNTVVRRFHYKLHLQAELDFDLPSGAALWRNFSCEWLPLYILLLVILIMASVLYLYAEDCGCLFRNNHRNSMDLALSYNRGAPPV